MARVLIVGGGCRGHALAHELVGTGHAVRITTRHASRRAAIEAVGAEPAIADPDVVGTLRYALDNVTILAWLLGTAAGPPAAVAALHDSRLRMMLSKTVDTTVRGFLYEAAGTVDAEVLARGRGIVASVAHESHIPTAVIASDPRDLAAWLPAARAAIRELLGSPIL